MPLSELATSDADAAEASDSPYEPDPVDLEAEAAEVAERLELIDPLELERRVELALGDDESAGYSDQARDDARREILADAAIVEDLIRARYGSDAWSRAARDARGTGHTLLSTQSAAYRDSQLIGLAERLAF